MKKLLLLSNFLLLISYLSFPQVAINTDGTAPTDPASMLEIKKGLKSKLRVRSLNYTDTAMIELSNRTAAGLGTDFLITARREEGLYFTTWSDVVGFINDSLFAMRRNGNIGIGAKFPVALLHIKSSVPNEHLRIEGVDPKINFYDYNQTRKGYLTYNSQMELGTPTGSGLSVVVAPGQTPVGYFTTTGRLGLGTSSPTDILHVNGNMNLTGVLKINGTSGTTGQVLTSNDSGDPEWRNAAFNNNSRFAATIPTNTGTGDLTYSTIYNLNPPDVTISGSILTINKSGLWHFEGYIYNRISWSAPPLAQTIYANFQADGMDHVMIDDGILDRDPMVATSADYVKTLHFSHDVYISAPATIRVFRAIAFSAGGVTHLASRTNGLISGYLISE